MSRSLREIYNYSRRQLIARKTFIFYSLIGVSGATLDYVCFVLLVHYASWHYLLTNIISTTLGITNNFFLNARFNFGVKDRLFSRFLRFYCIGLLGLALSSVILFLLIDRLRLTPEVSKFVVIVVIVILQYNLNKRFSFRKHDTD
jgi:putative flippase GtrA